MTEPVRRALLSVSDKTGLIAFATRLVSVGIELISTGGTATGLRSGIWRFDQCQDLGPGGRVLTPRQRQTPDEVST